MKHQLKKENKTILYLYAQLAPYVIPVLKEFTKRGYKIYVVSHDLKYLPLQTPYQPPFDENIEYLNRSDFKTSAQLYLFIKTINPALIYVAGWTDKLYCLTTKKIKKENNIPIISGFDSPWVGKLQWANVLFSKFRQRTWFTHILVAGMRQFEYAKRLGFKNHQIMSPVYSADMNLFEHVDITDKKDKYPHNLLFIGRLSEEKGIRLLLKAWNSVTNKKDWTLTIIGNGKLKDEILRNKNVVLKDFMSQTEIIYEMQNSGCFILPSTFEPWALVIHEAAAAGLPITATTNCGATTSFLINDYNGFSFLPGSIPQIENVIKKIITTSDEELYAMGERSKMLAKKIKPEYVAAAILGTLNEL
jgi:glycosyltransferase involved in cell wall biosynthesis